MYVYNIYNIYINGRRCSGKYSSNNNKCESLLRVSVVATIIVIVKK